MYNLNLVDYLLFGIFIAVVYIAVIATKMLINWPPPPPRKDSETPKIGPGGPAEKKLFK